MRPMHSPADTDAFDPALIKIDVTPHDQSIKHNAQVHITDSRKEKKYRRTTIGGISMSQIVVQPDISEVVKATANPTMATGEEDTAKLDCCFRVPRLSCAN